MPARTTLSGADTLNRNGHSIQQDRQSKPGKTGSPKRRGVRLCLDSAGPRPSLAHRCRSPLRTRFGPCIGASRSANPHVSDELSDIGDFLEWPANANELPCEERPQFCLDPYLVSLRRHSHAIFNRAAGALHGLSHGPCGLLAEHPADGRGAVWKLEICGPGRPGATRCAS